LEAFAGRYAFTNRETEVLRHLLDGFQNVDIAEKMNITENTVYKYVSSMITKTDAKSRGGLIAMFTARKE
jgi:two-component system nitrate/nitrite response regulator NarL